MKKVIFTAAMAALLCSCCARQQSNEDKVDEEYDVALKGVEMKAANTIGELFEIVKNGLTYPLIIPGVELTIDNSEYGNQCHILQLFINPKESNLMKECP